MLCGSVPSNILTDGGRSAANGFEDDDDDEDEYDSGEGGGGGVGSPGAWGEDALVSGDPGAIERAWGHAVDFIVDAGVLEVRNSPNPVEC